MLSESFSILSEDNLSQSSFEGIASTFHHTFQRQDHFRVGSSLVSWILQKCNNDITFKLAFNNGSENNDSENNDRENNENNNVDDDGNSSDNNSGSKGRHLIVL